jgi:hypothetical protein
MYIRIQPVPVAARSKAWVCGRPFSGTAGSNPVVTELFTWEWIHYDPSQRPSPFICARGLISLNTLWPSPSVRFFRLMWFFNPDVQSKQEAKTKFASYKYIWLKGKPSRYVVSMGLLDTPTFSFLTDPCRRLQILIHTRVSLRRSWGSCRIS